MGTNNKLGSKGNEDYVFGSVVKLLYQITGSCRRAKVYKSPKKARISQGKMSHSA